MAGTPRTDLRQYEELRPMAVEFNIAPEATASVILLQGKTKVSVSVCGPSQPRYLRHEVYDQCTLDVEYRANYYSSVSNRNVIENEGVSMVKKTFEPALLLEQYPRMMILIKINVLQDGGSLNAVVSNACTLALCQSGIPMSYIPVSVRCLQNQEKQFLLDPVSEEEASASAGSTFDFTFNTSSPQGVRNLLTSSCSGSMSIESMKSALEVCSAAAVNVDSAIKGFIAEKM